MMNAPQPTPFASIVDVTAETFQSEVVDRSRTTPVLLDFWATWCGPCKVLSPAIEKVVRETQGAVVLAKVDIDKNPELADALQIQSVPTVMLLSGGRIVDGFVGAKNEAAIRTFLEKHVKGQVPDEVEEALGYEREGDVGGALAVLRELARTEPARLDGRAHLARILLQTGQVDEGRTVYEALPPEALDLEPARAAKAVLDLQKNKVDLAPLRAAVARNEADVAARVALGRALLADQKHEEGMEMLLSAARLDVRFDGGAPRKALLEAFEALGETNPLVTTARRELSLLLCV